VAELRERATRITEELAAAKEELSRPSITRETTGETLEQAGTSVDAATSASAGVPIGVQRSSSSL
jgi:hypothetical protein